MVLIEVQEYYTTDLELNVFIKSDTVSSCVPETCSINCGDKAIIQLKTYKYVLERTTEKLLSNTTALLYEACSGKQLCNVTKIDGFQNSPINQQDGYYRIRYVCPGKKVYSIIYIVTIVVVVVVVAATAAASAAATVAVVVVVVVVV